MSGNYHTPANATDKKATMPVKIKSEANGGTRRSKRKRAGNPFATPMPKKAQEEDNVSIRSSLDDDIELHDEIYTEGSDRDSEINDSYDSDSDITIKSERSVSPTPYVPEFPNLPSGLAWYARQNALENTSQGPTIEPKQKRASVSAGKRSKKAPVSRKKSKKASVSRKKSKKDAGSGKEKSIPTRCSARNKSESALSFSAPSGEPIESSFTLKKGSKAQVLSHLADTPHFQPFNYRPLTNTTLSNGEMDPSEGSDKNFHTTPFIPPVRPYDAPKGKLWFMPPGETPVRVEEPEGPIRKLHVNEQGDIAVLHDGEKAKAKAKEAAKSKTGDDTTMAAAPQDQHETQSKKAAHRQSKDKGKEPQPHQQQTSPKQPQSSKKQPRAKRLKPESSNTVSNTGVKKPNPDQDEDDLAPEIAALLRVTAPDHYTAEEEAAIVFGFITKVKTDVQARELAALVQRREGGRTSVAEK